MSWWFWILCNSFPAGVQIESAENLPEKGRHIETSCPGSLLSIDVFYVGSLKNTARIYRLTACDCFCSFGCAKIYLHRTADSAVDLLETDLLPKAGNIVIQRLLQGNGKEFTTRFSGANHKFKQACDRNNIRHSFTRTKHLWTNGYTERPNQTILDQFYRLALRKKIYTSVEELQKDLDEFIYCHNFRRSHQGQKLKRNG
ncbi:MAG: transposase [Candidatus Latescibacteria bacterium]|nr:transposase [Candidatus Latescibacterota bacterium]